MKLQTPLHISVVIPAYNEADRLEATLQAVDIWLRQYGAQAEVIVVDDGSSDATGELAQRWQGGELPLRVLRHERNRGKGAAVRTGVLAARGELILVTDADLSTPIEEAAKLLALIDGRDVVIGSRAAPGADLRVPQGWLRQLLGKSFNRILRIAGMTTYRDTQCGFKLWRSGAAHAVFSSSRIDGFAFDVEVLLLAQRGGYHLAEVGVEWRNSPQSRVRMVSDSVKMFLAVLGLWLQVPQLREKSARDRIAP